MGPGIAGKRSMRSSGLEDSIPGVVETPKESSPPEFVGREEELARLQTAFGCSLKGNATAVLIEGAAGIGKTALVSQFLARVAARNGLVIRASASTPELPLSTLTALCGEIASYLATLDRSNALELLGSEAPTLSRFLRLPDRLAVTSDLLPGTPLEERARLHRGIAKLLANLTTWVPLVLWIDDFQEIDAESARFLTEALAPTAHGRLLLVTSSRTGEGNVGVLRERLSGWKQVELLLAPLNEKDAAALKQNVLGTVQTQSATGGNPRAIIEFALLELMAHRVLALSSGARIVLRILAHAEGPLSLDRIQWGRWVKEAVRELAAHRFVIERHEASEELVEVASEYVRAVVLRADDLLRRKTLLQQLDVFKADSLSTARKANVAPAALLVGFIAMTLTGLTPYRSAAGVAFAVTFIFVLLTSFAQQQRLRRSGTPS